METQIVAETARAAGGIGVLGINGKISLAQLVNFGLILLVLWRFAFKPIVARLEARSERIEKGLIEAKKAEVRLKQIEVERVDVLALAKKDAQDIIAKAKQEAISVQQELIERAKREVERVVAQGRGHLKNEKDAMIHEARKELVLIAVAAAEKILREGVSEKKSKSLAEEVVRKMT